MTFSSPVNFGPLIRALRHRDYALFTAGNSVSLIGTWMQRLATGWLAWELTHSTAWLGAIAFADLFPTVILGPLSGALADRWNRMHVIRIGEVLSLLQAVVLFALTASGLITIEILLGLALFLGAAQALNQPARLATIPALVAPADATAAVAINSIIYNVARFIGPAIGGVVIIGLGVSAAFAINAVTFVVFLAALSQIRVEQHRREGGHSGLFTDLAEGVRYTVRHPGIGPVFVLMITTSLCSRPVVELLPGFAGQVFATGADGLAILTSAVGGGAMFSGLWLSSRNTGPAGLLAVLLWTTVLLAASLMAFSMAPSMLVAVPALALGGFCMSVAGITLQTLIYFAVEPDMRGRVLSFYGIVFRGGPAIGALLMGAISEHVGLRWPLFAASVLVLAVWLLLLPSRAAIAKGLGGDRVPE